MTTEMEKAIVVDAAQSPPDRNDLQTDRQAVVSALQKQWQEAVTQEYASLNKNHTFKPVSEANSKSISCKRACAQTSIV
jgi:hypothetical protein